MGKIRDHKTKVHSDKLENVEVYLKFYESVMSYGGKPSSRVLCPSFCQKILLICQFEV